MSCKIENLTLKDQKVYIGVNLIEFDVNGESSELDDAIGEIVKGMRGFRVKLTTKKIIKPKVSGEKVEGKKSVVKKPVVKKVSIITMSEEALRARCESLGLAHKKEDMPTRKDLIAVLKRAASKK